MIHIGTTGITTTMFTHLVTVGIHTDLIDGTDGIDQMCTSVTPHGVDGMAELITAGTDGIDGTIGGRDGIAGMVDGPATLHTIMDGITGDMDGTIGDIRLTTMVGDTTDGITITTGVGEVIEDLYEMEHVRAGITTEVR